MRSKEIVTKIIINPIRTVRTIGRSMPKLFAVGLISLLSSLPLLSIQNRGVMAFAQQEQQQQQLAQASDPWSEAIKVAQSKVEAATSPGAFGHGVPDLNNLTTQDILLIFGIAAFGSMLVYVAVKYLLHNKEKIRKINPLNAITSSF